MIHKNIAVYIWFQLCQILTDYNNFCSAETGKKVQNRACISLFITRTSRGVTCSVCVCVCVCVCVVSVYIHEWVVAWCHMHCVCTDDRCVVCLVLSGATRGAGEASDLNMARSLWYILQCAVVRQGRVALTNFRYLQHFFSQCVSHCVHIFYRRNRCINITYSLMLTALFRRLRTPDILKLTGPLRAPGP